MFGAAFVKDGVGVVDVNQDSATLGLAGVLLEQAVGAGKRQVPDFPRRFSAAARAHQLVVGPERAVDESNIGGFGSGLPHSRCSGNRGSEEETPLALFHDKADRRVLRRDRAEDFLADIIGVTASKRQRAADEVTWPGRIF